MELLKLEGELFSHLLFPVLKDKAMEIINSNFDYLLKASWIYYTHINWINNK